MPKDRVHASERAQHTAVIDWDGTAVPAAWPEQPQEFMPGFLEAVFKLHAAGLHTLIASARLSPLEPGSLTERDPAAVWDEWNYIRNMLDDHGMRETNIWTLPGKPTGFVYVDDRAERYYGRPGSWKAMTEKILMRAAAEDPRFPAVKREQMDEADA
jgi:hypothetical protein